MSNLVQGPPITNGNLYVVVAGVFTASAGIAVALRLLTKTANKATYGADDWCIVAGYMLWLCEQGVGFAALNSGMKATSYADPRFMLFGKYMYISAIFYFPATTLIRIGIIFLYRRIFVTPKFYRTSIIVIVACILHCIPTTLGAIFTCYPPEASWDPAFLGKCLNYSQYFIASTSIELGLDVVILALPLKEISQLQMSLKRKVMLSLIFLLGGFEIITGTVRIILTAKSGQANSLHNILTDELWMFIHTGTLFLCACLPTYRPLLIVVKTWASSITRGSAYSNKHTQESSITTPSSNKSSSQTGNGRRGYKEIYGQKSHDDIDLIQVAERDTV